MKPSSLALLVCAYLLAWPAFAQQSTIDIATLSTASPGLARIHGSTGDGSFGVPVAGGFDCDGDGAADVAMAAMLASPASRDRAGTVYLAFGSGTVSGTRDTAADPNSILRIRGVVTQENAGSEIWMDDVTGDGLGDLLIARQNYTPSAGREGAGALSILVGSAALRAHADARTRIDLDNPPVDVDIFTLIGAQQFGRLGIWMRTGDVDSDGTTDFVVGADQEDHGGGTHSGALYVVRGGSHLAATATVDLASFGSTALAGDIARITLPSDTAHYHLGGTCQVADLDGNGRAEVLGAAALNRAGATLQAAGGLAGSAHGLGGSDNGTVYVAWDDNFPSGPWTAGYSFAIDASPGSRTIIEGADANKSFGEEMLGGLDFDGDGTADLFVGDIVGDLSPQQNRFAAGSGHVFYDAATLKGRTIDLESPPVDLAVANFLGANNGEIAADTAAQGDFDGDGEADLAFSAPHGSPDGRHSAGLIYVLYGGAGQWPATTDLANSPLPMRSTLIFGANGTSGGDQGDTLAYSAAAGDLDGDGKVDLIVNEMTGNGVGPGTEDKGNLIVIGGAQLSATSSQPTPTPTASPSPTLTFTAAPTRTPAPSSCPPTPRIGCKQVENRRSFLNYRVGRTARTNRLIWRWTRGAETTVDEFGAPQNGTDYSLCIYDASPSSQPAFSLEIPSSANCGENCWRAIGTRGFRYKSKALLPDGVKRATFRAGSQGRTGLTIRAMGENLTLPDFVTVPVTVQLHRIDTLDGSCWSATYTQALREDIGRFVARGP